MIRSVFTLLLAAACGGSDSPSAPGPDPQHAPAPIAIPLTGQAVPGMESFDRGIAELMTMYGVPGGAVSVVKDGRLIYARGFGYSDVENRIPVAPDALFRIASVSKPITSVAILKLVESGRLSLAQEVLPLISDLQPPAGQTIDPRWKQITIQHLLQHTGGWDRNRAGGYDPMFRRDFAAAVGAPAPGSAETIIRYMLGQPLDFGPGTRYVYSNFGYAILGRIIERVTGMSYEAYVKSAVLAPAGITRMGIGRTRLSERAAGEVKYYQAGAETVNAGLSPSVFPDEGMVPSIYGGFYLEAMDSHGAWIASAVDLTRFGVVADGRPSPADIISPSSILEMTSRNSGLFSTSPSWYGLGWSVRAPPQDNWSHGGSLPGTSSILVRSYHGYTWAAVLNARASSNVDLTAELDKAMWAALAGVTAFPSHDLFSRF